MKKIGMILTIIILILAIVGIAFVGYGYYKKKTMKEINPIATIEMEGFGIIKIELYPKQAPNTVANFIKLSNNGFYDGLTFHRIIKDFMIQGGDKKGDGSGSATLDDLNKDGNQEEYNIKGEFLQNNVKNTLKFEKGLLAMARSDYTQYSSELKEESYNSASSQFFIMTQDNASLNGQYTGFGKVIEGIDVVEKIAEVEVKAKETEQSAEGEESASNENAEVSTPVNPPKITSIKVETFGIDYGNPQTLEAFNVMNWMYKQYGIAPSALGQ